MPSIQIDSADIGEGAMINLTCLVQGNPNNITYEWLKNRKIISQGHSFVKNNAERTDTGNYSCTAKNLFDERTSNEIELYVKCKYSFGTVTSSMAIVFIFSSNSFFKTTTYKINDR